MRILIIFLLICTSVVKVKSEDSIPSWQNTNCQDSEYEDLMGEKCQDTAYYSEPEKLITKIESFNTDDVMTYSYRGVGPHWGGCGGTSDTGHVSYYPDWRVVPVGSSAGTAIMRNLPSGLKLECYVSNAGCSFMDDCKNTMGEVSVTIKLNDDVIFSGTAMSHSLNKSAAITWIPHVIIGGITKDNSAFANRRELGDLEKDLCKKEIKVVYINGMNTPPEDQAWNFNAIEKILGHEQKHGRLKNDYFEFKYDQLINTYISPFEDLAELYYQRLQQAFNYKVDAERNWEHFWLANSDKHSDLEWKQSIENHPLLEKLREAIENYKVEYDAYFTKDFATKFPNSYENLLTNDTKEMRSAVLKFAENGSRVILFPHSQGNLFANDMYEHARKRTTNFVPNMLKVVHIGSAALNLSGPYVRADKDRVLTAFELAGHKLAAANVPIPDWDKTVPGYMNKKDSKLKRHAVIETYLNRNLKTYEKIERDLIFMLDSYEEQLKEDIGGFFVVETSWVGDGDVDLHVIEPSSTSVYYKAPDGGVGILDKDILSSSDGSEKYVATCNSEVLEEGTYLVKLANYSRAEGARATVKILSIESEEEIAKKTITMGKQTGDEPDHTVFRINVSKEDSDEKDEKGEIIWKYLVKVE